MPEIRVRSRLAVPAAEAYRWHRFPGAFDRLAPPWERIRMVSSEGIEPGDRAVIEIRKGPFSLAWHARHEALDGGFGFADVQERGPFRRWYHEHRMEPAEGTESTLVDRIRFDPTGFSPVDRLAARMLEDGLRRRFVHRHRTTAADLALHAAVGTESPLTIGVTGASGTIGRALSSFLEGGGHRVVRFVRGTVPGVGERSWDPTGPLSPALFEGLDAIVHLSGAPIPARRWSDLDVGRMRSSRIDTTHRLARAVAAADDGPGVLVHASGISIYGLRRPEPVDETADTRPGEGVLPALADAWEAAAEPARVAGLRVASLRMGPLLAPGNGLLAPLRLAGALPVVPVPGTGVQVVSWISMDDVLGAVLHVLTTPELDGPVNLTAPRPVPLRTIVRDLAGDWRPVVSVPPGMMRAVFGPAADETVLSSVDVRPGRLLASGYGFRHPDVSGALDHALGRYGPGDHPDVEWQWAA